MENKEYFSTETSRDLKQMVRAIGQTIAGSRKEADRKEKWHRNLVVELGVLQSLVKMELARRLVCGHSPL